MGQIVHEREDEMKTRYKFIHFRQARQDGVWFCFNNNNGDSMGVVEFYKRWKQYVIDFGEGCVFKNQCLKDIADFLEQLNKKELAGKDKDGLFTG